MATKKTDGQRAKRGRSGIEQCADCGYRPGVHMEVPEGNYVIKCVNCCVILSVSYMVVGAKYARMMLEKQWNLIQRSKQKAGCLDERRS